MYLIFAFSSFQNLNVLGQLQENLHSINVYCALPPSPPQEKVLDLFLRPLQNELLPQHASLSMPVFHTNADLLTYTQLFVISHLKIKRLAVPFYFFRGDVEDLSILHDILLGNFPRFSAHRLIEISEIFRDLFQRIYISNQTRQ